MLVIKKICDYTIPIFGNKRVLPYAKLLVSDGITEKLRPIIDDGGRQYITFNRKRYYIKNAGSLYSPHYVLPMNGTSDWIARVEPLRFEYKEVAV